MVKDCLNVATFKCNPLHACMISIAIPACMQVKLYAVHEYVLAASTLLSFSVSHKWWLGVPLVTHVCNTDAM